MKFAFATGSLIMTNDFDCPDVARGPIAGSVTSLRKRPWLSRKRFVWVLREMRFPSPRVCVVSETAVALNGAPVTTFPPCIPSKPSNSMRSPIGPANIPSPGPPGICASGGNGGGGAPCASNDPAAPASIPARSRFTHTLRFIISSPLLSRTVANSSPTQSRPAPSSTARSMLRPAPPAPSALVHPPASTFPKRPLLPSVYSSPERSKIAPALHECLSRQPHRLRQSIITDEQIHLNPFAGALFVKDRKSTRLNSSHRCIS